MIIKYTRLLFTLLIVLLISSCGTSNLSYKNEQLNLQINESLLQVHGILVEQKRENYSTLFLTRNLIRLDDGSMVVYEKAKTDIDYEFDSTTSKTIAIIFDAKKVIKVYYDTLIYAFQVILHDNSVLNMISTQGFDQELDMVYGMSTEKFNSILKVLDPNIKPVYYKNINLINRSEPFLSRWSTWKVHFVPLVVPVQRLLSY